MICLHSKRWEYGDLTIFGVLQNCFSEIPFCHHVPIDISISGQTHIRLLLIQSIAPIALLYLTKIYVTKSSTYKILLQNNLHIIVLIIISCKILRLCIIT